eukprot:15946_1
MPWICSHVRLLTSIITSVLLYYFDILTDIAVLYNYYLADENVFFGISIFAIFSSLLAQIIFSPLLSIYRHSNEEHISIFLCVFRLSLSILYLTPLYLLYKFLSLQCCRFAKGSKDELQLARIEDTQINNNNSYSIEEQRQDPNMIVFNSDNILTQERKYTILSNMLDDAIRYSFIKSCFQSSINIFIQIFILGKFYLLNGSHSNIEINIFLLDVSALISFICLCNASWYQISDVLINNLPKHIYGYNIFLFRLRSILESAIRTLRFMIISVTFGAMYGVAMIGIEIFYKYIILICNKYKCNSIQLYKTIGSLMLFSKEIFKKNPCLIRFVDVILWTVLLLIGAILSIQILNFGNFKNGICDTFLQFQNDCLPLEIIITITTLIILLILIYMLSPSIFNLISSLDENIEINTIIDVSQPVENPSMPKKGPKRKYSNSNNLVLMSVDEQISDPIVNFHHDDAQYDYQQAD